MCADEVDGGAVDRGFDPPSIPIVHKGRRAHVILLHFHEPVLGIIQQRVRIGPDDPRDLVTIGVIPVFLRRTDMRDRMDVTGVVVVQIYPGFDVQIAGGIIRIGFRCAAVERPTRQAVQGIIAVGVGLTGHRVRDLVDIPSGNIERTQSLQAGNSDVFLSSTAEQRNQSCIQLLASLPLQWIKVQTTHSQSRAITVFCVSPPPLPFPGRKP